MNYNFCISNISLKFSLCALCPNPMLMASQSSMRKAEIPIAKMQDGARRMQEAA